MHMLLIKIFGDWCATCDNARRGVVQTMPHWKSEIKKKENNFNTAVFQIVWIDVLKEMQVFLEQN